MISRHGQANEGSIDPVDVRPAIHWGVPPKPPGSSPRSRNKNTHNDLELFISPPNLSPTVLPPNTRFEGELVRGNMAEEDRKSVV